MSEVIEGSARGARHVRPSLGLGTRLPPAPSAQSVGRRGHRALGVSGLSGPAIRLRWGRARARVRAWPRAPDSEGVGAAGEPVRSVAGAAPVPPGGEAPGPPYIPRRRPRTGRGERSGGQGSGPGGPAGEVRRGAEGGGHCV